MAKHNYDEALFLQLLSKRKRPPDNSICRNDILEVFRVVAWDLYLAIEQQAPHKRESADKLVMDEFVPRFVRTLEHDGWKVRDD